MWKVLGGVFLLGGVAGVLYNWTLEQREKQKALDDVIIFLRKSVAVMQNEKMQIIKYFERQNREFFLEIARRLSTNTYAKGQAVWEEVFKEEEQNLSLDKETFQIVLQAGEGVFGKSREENIRFLQKSISELESKQKEMKIRDAQERKVWIPVGMLGAVMLVIILI